MDIKSSLAIEDNNQGKINLILLGSFVRVYNQSFYLLTEGLNNELKPIVGVVKSAGNRFVVYGGFPAYQVESNYLKAIRTTWGFQLSVEFNLQSCHLWLSEWESLARRTQQALRLSS